MIKITEELISDYIFGNDIEEYSLTELETNKKFMERIINVTNDKNFYNLCSKELKKNYDFVKFLIIKFSDDKSFIMKVADFYLENTLIDDETKKMELNIIMSELLNECKEIEYLKYKTFANLKYKAKMSSINFAIKTTSRDLKDYFGLGFILILDEYKNNEIIINYFAKKLTNNLIYRDDFNLEEYLHKKYKTKNEIKNIRLNNMLINYIDLFDHELSNYLMTHIELLNYIKSDITRIIDNWDKYNEIKDYSKYRSIIDEVYDYMEYEWKTINYLSTDILYFIAKKFNILNKIKEIENEDFIQSDFDEFYSSSETNIDITKMDFDDLRHLIELEEIVKNILIKGEYDNYINEDNNKNCKVLTVNFKKGVKENE